MERDEEFMLLALEEARLAKDEGELPFGAVVIFNNRVIGQAHSTELGESDVTAHAEIKAVSHACQKLRRKHLVDSTLYSSVEPCNMCASAIFQARIPRIVIAASREDLPAILRPRTIRIHDLAKDSGYQPVLVTGILRKRSIDLFQNTGGSKLVNRY